MELKNQLEDQLKSLLSIGKEKKEQFDPSKAMDDSEFVKFLNNYETVSNDDDELAQRFIKYEFIKKNSGKVVEVLVKDFAQQAGEVRVTSEMRNQVQEIITRWAAQSEGTDLSDLLEALTKSDELRLKVEEARKKVELGTKDRIKDKAGAELPTRKLIRSYTDGEIADVMAYEALFGSIDDLYTERSARLKGSEDAKKAEEEYSKAFTELENKRAVLVQRFDFFEQMREVAKQAAEAELRAKFGVSDVAEINLEKMQSLSKNQLETAYAYVQKLLEQNADSEMIKEIMQSVEMTLSNRVIEDLADKLKGTKTYSTFSSALRTVLVTPEFVKIWGNSDPIGRVKTMVREIAEGTSSNISTGVRTMAKYYLQIIDK